MFQFSIPPHPTLSHRGRGKCLEISSLKIYCKLKIKNYNLSPGHFTLGLKFPRPLGVKTTFDLLAVEETIAVGVGNIGISLVHAHFLVIVQAIAVGIRCTGIRTIHIVLTIVRQPVAIGIARERLQTTLDAIGNGNVTAKTVLSFSNRPERPMNFQAHRLVGSLELVAVSRPLRQVTPDNLPITFIPTSRFFNRCTFGKIIAA